MNSSPYDASGAGDELDLSTVPSNVGDDGRVNINFSRHTSLLKRTKKADKKAAHRQSDEQRDHCHIPKPRLHHRKDDFKRVTDEFAHVPRLNLAIIITGSRGDVQPFIALGQTLQKPPYSHRVRICTHAVFKDFVEENGLEFHSIGGDPAKLMAYMVKNPGILPSIASIKAGDIGSRKAELAEMLEGAWGACTEPGDGITEFDIKEHENDPDILLSYPKPFVRRKKGGTSFGTSCAYILRFLGCRRYYRESSIVCCHAYCGKAVYSSAYDVHHAMVTHRCIPTPTCES